MKERGKMTRDENIPNDETEQSIKKNSNKSIAKEKYYSEIMECIKLNDFEKIILNNSYVHGLDCNLVIDLKYFEF